MSAPGNRVDVPLTTAEWKAFRLMARSRGLTIKAAAQDALREWTRRGPDEIRDEIRAENATFLTITDEDQMAGWMRRRDRLEAELLEAERHLSTRGTGW